MPEAPLTPEEEAELAQLELEAPLSPEEEAELLQLEAVEAPLSPAEEEELTQLEAAPVEQGFLESGGKTEVLGVPLDFGGAVRTLEAAPEIATRLSRGDSLVDAVTGTGDFVAGIEDSAVDVESAKLAATFDQTQAAGHAATAALNAVAKLGGIPTSTTGKGIILGPLELARQLGKTRKVKKAAAVSDAVAKTTPKGVTHKQLEFGATRQEPLFRDKDLDNELALFQPSTLPTAQEAAETAAREEARSVNQLNLFNARQLPPEQLALELGEDSNVFLKRGLSDDTASEAGERALVNPEATTVADVINRVDDVAPIMSKTGKVVNFLAGKAVSPIRKAGNYSPAMKRIADLMGGGEDNLVRGFHHDQWAASGRFIVELDDAVQTIKRWTGAISRKTNDKLVKDLWSGAKNPPAAAVRGVLNSFHAYLREAGVDVGFATNFFPRKYNADYLSTSKGAKHWVDTLTANGNTAARALEARDNIINSGGFLELSVDRSGRALSDGSKVSSSIKGRTIDLPDEVLAPFLRSDNAHTILRDYIEAGTRTAEYTRRFGKGETKLNELMAQASQELAASGRNIADIRDHVYNVADTLVHSYNRLAPNSPVGVINKIATPSMHILTLPLATVASLTEPIMILGRASLRPSSALKALPSIMNSVMTNSIRTVYKGMPKADATRAIEELGLGLDAAMAERLQAISQGDTSKVSALFFKANFLHQWTRFVMIAANETGKNMIKGHLRELATGASPKKQVALSKDLLALGVDPKAGVAWTKNGADETAEFFQDSIKRGGQRFVTDVVMIPRSTELPLWHSNPHVKTFSQLKSFPTMFGNTVMTNWLKQIAKGTPKQKFNVAATGVLATIGGMYTSSLSDYLRYGEDGNPHVEDFEPYQHIARGFDKFGGSGVASVGRDALMSSEFGRDAATVLAGPLTSKVTEVAEIVTAKNKPRAAAKVIANNMSFLSVNKEGKDAIADTVEEFFEEFQ